MLKRALACLLILSPCPRAAETAGWSATELAGLGRLCAETARRPPAVLAQAVAAQAGAEHESFGGHVIARDGRMRRFGAVEADAQREEVPGRGLPWQQVMRYWETLGPLSEEPLRLRPDQSEPAAQALMRAAAVDVPWSAAFVSHVAVTAGVPRSRFTPSMAHIDYVAEAGRRSAEEAAGRPSDRFYRACNPHRTAGRPGDLLCLHRHSPADLPQAREGLFALLVPQLARGERPVWNLHCDVVTGRDDRHRTLTLIGGNVLQSVTRRELPTDRHGALARPRRAQPCEDNRPPGPLCQPEAAPWFVLLQAVDAD